MELLQMYESLGLSKAVYEYGEQVLASLLKASAARRHALVMVTHDPVVAARCDRTLRLEGGELVHEA